MHNKYNTVLFFEGAEAVPNIAYRQFKTRPLMLEGVLLEPFMMIPQYSSQARLSRHTYLQVGKWLRDPQRDVVLFEFWKDEIGSCGTVTLLDHQARRQ